MGNTDMKLVTVMVPNYNCGRYLNKCISHLVEQTYTNLEIIICDDGSTDNSLTIINEWLNKDSRIKFLKNDVNQGIVKTYNRCFSVAQGDYVMIQDADDWSALDRVEKQVAVIEKYGVGMCVTNYVEQYVNGKEERYDAGPSKMIDIKSNEVWGATPSLMFRKTVLNEIPGYRLYFDRIASFDRYFIMEILERYKGYYLNEYLYNWLIHPNSDHRSINIKEPRYMAKMVSHDIYLELKRQRISTGTDWVKENDMDALRDFEKKLLRNKELIGEKFRIFACIQIDHGNYNNAKELLKEALKKAPFLKINYNTLLYYIRSKYFGKKVITNTTA